MAGSSGTAGLSDTRGDKNVVAQIAQLSWNKVKSAEKMAGAEKEYAKKKLKVGEEGGLSQEEFRQRFGRGSFFRKALGSEFGGDKVARNRGRVESFFDKDVPAGRDATKSKRSRYRSQFDYGDVEAKDPMVGSKPKTDRTKAEGERKTTRSSRMAVNEAMASALAGIEIQLTKLSERFSSTVSVPEGLIEVVNKQSKVITEGFDGLSNALYSLLGSIQKQTATMVRLDQEQKILDQKNLDRQQALDEESLLEGQNGGAGNAAVTGFGKIGGKGAGGGGILGRMFGANVLAKKIGRRGAARAGVRAAAAFGGKGAAKFMAKKTAGLAAKTGLKSGLKKIPLLGLGVASFFAAQRAMKGDLLGAGLELASGAASMVPGAGTAASLGVDGILAARDAGAVPFAKGGMITKPMLGIVGEGKDPEMITPWNKRTFEMMNKARLEAIQKNKNKFADVQAKGLEEYYENRGGWERFGEILKSLFGGGGGPPGDDPPGPGEPLPGDAPPEIKALMEAISSTEGTWDSVNYGTGPGKIPGLENMTIDQALKASSDYIAQHGGTGTLGKFQQHPDYLRGRAQAAGLDPSKDKFSKENQVKIQRSFLNDTFGGETKLVQLVKDKNYEELSRSLGRDIGWPSLPGGSQSQPGYTPAMFGAKIEKSLAVQKATPPPSPTPQTPVLTSWAMDVNNYGMKLGEKVTFMHKDKEYFAERVQGNGKQGWAIFSGGVAGVGGQLIETKGTSNLELRVPLEKALQQRTNTSSALSAPPNSTANRTATASEDVAMARAGGPKFDVINVGTTGSNGAAVPKGDNVSPGLDRRSLAPAFAEVSVG